MSQHQHTTVGCALLAYVPAGGLDYPSAETAIICFWTCCCNVACMHLASSRCLLHGHPNVAAMTDRLCMGKSQQLQQAQHQSDEKESPKQVSGPTLYALVCGKHRKVGLTLCSPSS